jgi:NADP-dependent 3-hydroxy acid dehydrogenase YdfG
MGCKVIATGRRAERLQALKEAVTARFPESKLLPYPLDVTDMEAVKAMPAHLAEAHPLFAEVDILGV